MIYHHKMSLFLIKKQKFIRVIHQMAFLYPRLTIRKHTYYIRVAVPKRLINIVKKRNIVYSLQTKDYQEALYRVREESYKVDKMFNNYEAKMRKSMLKDKKERRYLEEIDIDKIMKSRWVELFDIIERKGYQIQKGTITFEQLAFFKPESFLNNWRFLNQNPWMFHLLLMKQKMKMVIWFKLIILISAFMKKLIKAASRLCH